MADQDRPDPKQQRQQGEPHTDQHGDIHFIGDTSDFEDVIEAGEAAERGESPAEGDTTASDAQATAELQQALEAADRKADEHWNAFLRAQAELENLRRRSARDVDNARKFSLEKFAVELLPVRDSLELGLAAGSDDSVGTEKLREGMELTLKMFTQVMERFDIQAIDPVGKRFDPTYHEAMATEPSDEAEPNTVLRVLQKGYLLHDRLIRPAMVIVAQPPKNEETPRVDEQA